jgi:catechol 2,3-dioxygenase-like lactoylglutathione lyase family enzyme
MGSEAENGREPGSEWRSHENAAGAFPGGRVEARGVGLGRSSQVSVETTLITIRKVSRAIAIDHCVIAISDWQRSNAFYRDVVGADLIERGDGYLYRLGDQFLSVHGPGDEPRYVARDPVRPGNSELCLVWSGPIEDALSHLDRYGVEIVAGPVDAVGPLGRQGRHVYFRDPDGSLLEFVSYE